MKEITRINLASVPYNVEIEAKKELERYCEDIQGSLGADMDAMREIEARMTELLAERGVVGEKVIRSEDVVAIHAQLGDASDFAATDEETRKGAEMEKPVRRLMRDTSNRVLGGVCSGLGLYFAIDPLLVRLAAVILTILTAGLGIVAYLLLWALLPPARSAADRLQMAGKPVNITNIKDVANTMRSTREPMLLMFLRYMAAGLLLSGALGTLAALAFATLRAGPAVLAMPPKDIAVTVISALTGVFLVALLSLLAYALLAKKFTQKMGIVLITIMLAGLSSFVIGVAGLRFTYDTPLNVSQVTKPLAADDLSGVKRLTVESTGNAAVSYTSTNNPSGASVLFPQEYKNSDVPTITLKRVGDSAILTISGGKAQECQEGCNVWVDVQGPALEKVDVKNSRLIYSQLSEQATTFTVLASGGARVVVSSAGQFTDMAFEAAGMSDIDMAAASIVNVRGTLSQSGSVQLGNIENADVTAPSVCPAETYNAPSLRYASARSIKINNVAYNASQPLPCLRINASTD